MQAVDNIKENPFVAVAAKKQRKLKKKMDHIIKFEGQLAAGKLLDEEQLQLVHSKSSVEKALAEISSIKAQLEEVAKEQESLTETHVHKHTVTTTEEVTTEVEFDKNVTTNEETVDNGEGAVVEHTTEEITDFHLKVVQYAVSTMTETDVDEVVHAPAAPTADFKPQLEALLTKLLKVLHVYERYQAITSHPLPENVDFFGKALLGMTSIRSFNDILGESFRIANNYVNGDSNVFVRGVTYAQMSDVIDQLADEMEKLHVRGHGPGSLSAKLLNAVVPQAAPAVVPAQPEPEVVTTVVEEVVVTESIEIDNLQLQFGEGFSLSDIPEELIQSIVRTDVEAPTFGTTENADAVPIVAEVNITIPVDSETTGFVLSAEEDQTDKTNGKQRNNKNRRNKFERKERAAEDETKPAVVSTEGEEGEGKKKKFNKKFQEKEPKEVVAAAEEGVEGKQFKKKPFKNDKKKANNENNAEKKEAEKPAAPPAPKSWKDIAKSTSDAATPSIPAAAPVVVEAPAAAVPAPTPAVEKVEKKPFKEFRPKKNTEEGASNNHNNSEEQGNKFQRNNGEKKFVRKEYNNQNGERPPRGPKPATEEKKAEVVADLDDGFQQPRRHQTKPKPTGDNNNTTTNSDNKVRYNKDQGSKPFKPRSVSLAKPESK